MHRNRVVLVCFRCLDVDSRPQENPMYRQKAGEVLDEEENFYRIEFVSLLVQVNV